jgi:cytidine deaminase
MDYAICGMVAIMSPVIGAPMTALLLVFEMTRNYEVTIAAMVAAGDTRLTEVYVIAGSPSPVPPCGGCRQKLAEFGAGGVRVTMATTSGAETVTTIADLLPGAFGAGHMKEG